MAFMTTCLASSTPIANPVQNGLHWAQGNCEAYHIGPRQLLHHNQDLLRQGHRIDQVYVSSLSGVQRLTAVD